MWRNKKPRNTHKYALRKSQLQAELKSGPLNGSTENEQNKLDAHKHNHSLVLKQCCFAGNRMGLLVKDRERKGRYPMKEKKDKQPAASTYWINIASSLTCLSSLHIEMNTKIFSTFGFFTLSLSLSLTPSLPFFLCCRFPLLIVLAVHSFYSFIYTSCFFFHPRLKKKKNPRPFQLLCECVNFSWH